MSMIPADTKRAYISPPVLIRQFKGNNLGLISDTYGQDTFQIPKQKDHQPITKSDHSEKQNTDKPTHSTLLAKRLEGAFAAPAYDEIRQAIRKSFLEFFYSRRTKPFI